MRVMLCVVLRQCPSLIVLLNSLHQHQGLQLEVQVKLRKNLKTAFLQQHAKCSVTRRVAVIDKEIEVQNITEINFCCILYTNQACGNEKAFRFRTLGLFPSRFHYVVMWSSSRSTWQRRRWQTLLNGKSSLRDFISAIG